jgi:hypothetical protein
MVRLGTRAFLGFLYEKAERTEPFDKGELKAPIITKPIGLNG